jgi:hypothetical protein
MGRLPDDPCDYGYGGCNRLYCPHCKLFVRAGQPGFCVKRDHRWPDLNALFVTENWADLPFVALSKSANWRLYVCKCSQWDASTKVWVENDRESPSDPNVPWRCAGHPVPQLPIALDDGLTVAADSDWTALVEKILRGARPRPLMILHEGPALWLAWLWHHLSGLPDVDKLSNAVVAETFEDLAHAAAFDDDDDLLWLAKHAVEIDAAGPGRWKPLLSRLCSKRRSREHLIVNAGTRIIQSGKIDLDAVRAWMKKDHSHHRDGWKVLLGQALDEEMRKSHSPRN